MAMPTCQIDSRHLLAQAREDLYLGDTRQASQKGWAAAAQIVKSVAETRGWAHHDHAALFIVVIRRLVGLKPETRTYGGCSTLPATSR